ncbi:2-succinyl-6-hydroxy-2,4-cyclohexadiene-1-carboxylate synthase [Neobacillus sp. D3-1R]|uniref:2-succinyl-6-hydroxy-2, 4-cyclohexadiene-1-carboxylate synthase n=1 Tax=Neobacillus sp. D3-1R TaxID=3445778 RepID=UPI003F9ED2BC
MKYFVEGVSYHVEVCGEGYPLLLLHGFTGRGSNWSPYCSILGKNAHMIMPDIIGHGLTDSPEDIQRFEIETVAKDIFSIINQLGFEKIDIHGYSMGGRLALSMALLFPERVRKLILESASPGLNSAVAREERRASDLSLAQSIKDNGIVEFVNYWENIPLFHSQKKLSAQVQSTIRKQRLTNSPEGLANSLIGMGTGSQPSYWDRLHMIEAKVLMIVGEYDEKFCRIAFEMQKSFKYGKIYKVPNCGHAIHVELPEKFGTIVNEFLLNT